MSYRTSGFERERDEAFLSLDRSDIMSFCRKHGIEIYGTCLNKFWPLVYYAVLAIDHEDYRLMEKAKKYLYENNCEIYPGRVFVKGLGWLEVPKELQLT